jgi:1-acyl-sn-glycerol-3-phosphate acyltransferase
MQRSLLRSILRFLFSIFTRLEIHNQENIPPAGPVLLAHNHLSRLDAPLVFILLLRHDATWLVAHTYRKVPLLNWFVDSIHGIWINRETADLGALKLALAHLRAGGLLGIAPEGYISHTGGLRQAKTGIAYLADKGHAQVVPLAISGTDRVFRDLFRFRRACVQVRVGQAFTLPPVGRDRRDEDLQRNTDTIMCQIAALLPEEYRGIYATHPGIGDLLEPKP